MLPISIAAPWGLNVGDGWGTPATGEDHRRGAAALHLREEFGEDPDLDEVYDHSCAHAGDLDALAAERRFPVIG